MSLERAAEIILSSRYLIALTGAGISAESGIPTFRGKGGLWEKYRPEELATPEAFARNPKLVWEWYAWRINLIQNAQPNPAHIALAELEKLGVLKVVITQNVDNLHERAGTKNLIKIHGDIFTVWCIKCSYEEKISETPRDLPIRCPKCGGLMRPGVVWFGEPIPPNVLTRVYEEAERADAILVIGTSGVVMPAGAIPRIVKGNGGKIIEINIEETVITPIADVSLRGKAGEILPSVLEIIMRR